MANLATAPSIDSVITMENTTEWVQKGWSDFKRAPGISLLYGGLFVGIGYGIFFFLMASGLGSMILPAAASFMLIAPLATVLLYGVSKRLHQGEPVNISSIIKSTMEKSEQLAVVGFALAFLTMAWLLLALIIFSVFFGGTPPALDNFYSDLIVLPQAPVFLVVGCAVGAVIAVAAFAVSVLSLPLIMDRDINGIEAVIFSVTVARHHWRVMMSWAATLVLLTACGMATFFVGLAVTVPVCGYASWHAYKQFAD